MTSKKMPVYTRYFSLLVVKHLKLDSHIFLLGSSTQCVCRISNFKQVFESKSRRGPLNFILISTRVLFQTSQWFFKAQDKKFALLYCTKVQCPVLVMKPPPPPPLGLVSWLLCRNDQYWNAVELGNWETNFFLSYTHGSATASLRQQASDIKYFCEVHCQHSISWLDSGV